jgi:hypothetical protein
MLMCCDIVIKSVNIKYLYNAIYQSFVITQLILLKQTKHVCFGFVRTPLAFMIFLVEKTMYNVNKQVAIW